MPIRAKLRALGKELENKERYKELFKDNIEKAKSETNKELAKLRKEKLLTIE